MILKKPYAFFIKHFRLIHIFLFILSTITIYKSTPAVTFFRSYVENSYSTSLSENMISSVIPFILFVAVILIFLINVGILSLFTYKKKRKNFYLFYTIYYALLFIILILGRNALSSLNEMTFTAASARAYKDIALIAYIPQFLFVFVCGIRALGFNIKQFNFQRDLKDLEISSSDSEEIELSLGLETYRTQRNFNRFKREFIYYIKENKLMVIIASVILTGLIIYFIIASLQTYTKKVNLGELFSYDTFTMSVDDAIITNLDAGGNKLKNNKYYLLLKVSINNNGLKDKEFQYDNLKIYYTDTDYINPSLDAGTNFVDYALPFTDSPIVSGTKNTYVFAYELNTNILNNKFFVKMNTGAIKKSNLYYVTSALINIDPIIIDEVADIGKTGLNQVLNLSGTYLLNTTITINDYKLTDKYIYNYKACVSSNNCREFKDIISRTSTNETLLVLTGTVKIDETCAYFQNKNAKTKFANNFFKVEYIKNDTKYISNIVDVTPSNFNEGFILKVSNGITDADEINLLTTIRNKQYRISLKSWHHKKNILK